MSWRRRSGCPATLRGMAGGTKLASSTVPRDARFPRVRTARVGAAAAASLVRGTEPMGGSAAQPVAGEPTLGDQNRKEIPPSPACWWNT